MALEPCMLPGHPLWEVFHESSKWKPSDWAEISRRAAAHARVGGPAPARPRRGPLLALPAPSPGTCLGVGLDAALQRRRSAREFAGLPLRLEEAGTLLWTTAGMISAGGAGASGIEAGGGGAGGNGLHARRTVPSAGACYPIDAYFWFPVPLGGVHPGPYHYDAAAHSGALVTLDPPETSLSDLLTVTAFPALIERAGLLIVLAGVFARTTDKYGARGYRFVLLEAGHAAQNIYLAAAALDLGAVALGGLDDAMLDALLGLDGARASVLYAVAVGHNTGDCLKEHGDSAGG
ncbi:MAG: SagB/ThcOx family dehydrogenase [Armatimonadetes bacterium]|nr:SagB/ThcOx family dehydrogenase [Armatimonadota bacterium]